MRTGQFDAVVVDWGVDKSIAKGTPYIWADFSASVDGNLESVKYKGYLTDGTKDRTIEDIYKMGFNGDLEGLAKGRDSKCLESGKNLKITVVEDPKYGFQIQWVNLPGVDVSGGVAIINQFKADFLAEKPKTSKLDLKGV